MLIVMLYYGSQSNTIQVGPYANSADCEKAATFFNERVVLHECIPMPYNRVYNGFDSTKKLPEEFD
jgi:hypothetical protein